MNFTSLTLNLGEIVAQVKPSSDQVETGFIYVIAAFTAVWLLIAAYLFWLQRRQESLRQEVELLRREEADRQQTSPQTSHFVEVDPTLEASSPAKPTQSNVLG